MASDPIQGGRAVQLSAVESKVQKHPNHGLTLAFWDAVAAGDAVRVGRCISSKAVWHMAGASRVAGTYWGASGLLDLLGAIGELIEGSVELLDVYVSHDGAVVRCRIDAQRAGRNLLEEQLVVLRIEDGLIVEGSFTAFDQLAYDRFLKG